MSSAFEEQQQLDLAKLGVEISEVFEHIDAAILIVDQDRKILAANGLANDMFGYDTDELIGQDTRILFSDPKDYAELGSSRYNADAKAGVGDKYVVSYLRKDGSSFDGATVGGVVRNQDNNETRYFGLITDVSRQTAAESALNRLHIITSSRELSFEQRVDEILKLGTRQFGLPIGIFSKITGQKYEVQQARHPENALKPGMEFDLGVTYCSHVFNADDVCAYNHVAESEIKTHPCYANFALEAYLGAPVVVDGERFGTLNFSSPNPVREFTGQDIELVRLFATWIGHEVARLRDWRELEASRKELERLSTIDPLTGLYNRRHMERCLRTELDRMKRYDKQFVVGLLDFDNFKDLNDNYGHTTGDEALKLFAKVSEEIMRETDVIARWGGEEFLILMPETGAAGAISYLQRLTDRVRETDFHVGDEELHLTLSVGLGIAELDDTADALIVRADIAMQESKQARSDTLKMHSETNS